MIYLIFKAEFFVKSNCLHKIKIIFFTLLESEIQVLNMNPTQNDLNYFDLTNYRNLHIVPMGFTDDRASIYQP